MVIAQMGGHVKHGQQGNQNNKDPSHLIQGQRLILIDALIQLINLMTLIFLDLLDQVIDPVRLLMERIMDVLQLDKNPSHQTPENRHGKGIAKV